MIAADGTAGDREETVGEMTDRQTPLQQGIAQLRELPPARRCATLAAIALQLGLFAAAEIDIQRRPASQIRGGKARWRLACLVNFVGPIAYFRWGRLPSRR